MATVTGGGGMEAKLREIATNLAKAREVRVGFLEGATYPDGESVASVAAIQNFGAPEAGIPARPFFSDMIARHKGDWGVAFGELVKTVDYDTDKALALMGEGMAGQLREQVVETNSPALSPVTVLLRQRFPTRDGMTFSDVIQAMRDVAAGERGSASTKPLVWSGHLLNSVDKEVIR
jgi:hypothetical protein